ncbi:RNA methyltransferase [Parasegetibacter sp. NRK P23]|uniref:RNA methyltransferase n=1 Tax=Parasegetibacter sp. NRK P23 TaxID=2942999 RepID=UPI0020439B66|nr:RNA methyltransferase [Parasegetibacter sp. NRK P23]MCM5528493.1 RNA methyltransferase [Parasegetibacter sp. NRK P23]
MRKLSMDELGRKTVQEFRLSEKTPLVLVLDNVRSMHNVGSIFRTADAFLLESIVLCGYTPQPPHRDIHKTALGATETVQWRYAASLKEAVEELINNGYKVWAIEQAEGSRMLNEFEPEAGEKLALILGNEVEGVQASVLPLCEGCIEVPQLGMKHSLNVSVTAGIVAWDLFSKIRSNA